MSEIKEIMNDTLDLWPLAITSRKRNEQLKNKQARDICDAIKGPQVVEPIHEFQPILPELWQAWMAKEIMSHELINQRMDYLEAMERRDKITAALITLRSEAAALNMQDVLSKISTAGANLLDELWRQGGLGD